jgi:HemK-like putative methylase
LSERIRTRKPAAYLTREAWLQGVPFYVDERAIVPRSFIAEFLPTAASTDWLGEHTRRVLDLCTGNGSLAVLAAMVWPDVKWTGADLSARRAGRGPHQPRPAWPGKSACSLQLSDGLAAVTGPYDLILCNPPYVNADSMATLPAEYRAEPTLALAGGALTAWISSAACCVTPRKHMSENAVLVLEIGNERVHFEAAFPQLEVVWLETSGGRRPGAAGHPCRTAGGRWRALAAICLPASFAPRRPAAPYFTGDCALWREMITLKNVILRRSAKVLLDGANVTINPGEKVGLVGRNGAGKSTLFALFNGSLHEDGGDFYVPKQWRMAQVAQDMPETDEPATDFVVGGDTRLMELRQSWAIEKAATRPTPTTPTSAWNWPTPTPTWPMRASTTPCPARRR